MVRDLGAYRVGQKSEATNSWPYSCLILTDFQIFSFLVTSLIPFGGEVREVRTPYVRRCVTILPLMATVDLATYVTEANVCSPQMVLNLRAYHR